MDYFVISTGEDGDVSLQIMDRETLLKRLNENYWGDSPVKQGDFDTLDRRGLFIIEGKLVAPKPKKVVSEWEI